MRPPSPLQALSLGLLAGLAGCVAQDLFFALTKRIAPRTPKDAFDPPEPEQDTETATQTVARRAVEKLARRGPLRDKARAGRIVHYGFGSSWGGAYGLVAGSIPGAAGPVGGAVFGLAVWATSDNLLLPAFRVAAWPKDYPIRVHAYAVAAHVVYGTAVWAAFRGMRHAMPSGAALLGALWLTRRFPRLLRPTARDLARRALRVGTRAKAIARASNFSSY